MDREKSLVKEDQYHACKLWEIGTEQLMAGQVELALETINESLRVFPTAEGYTYRAWAISFQGKYGEAINDCMRAIKLDVGFGNPYNDIGVYLMQLGRLDEAIPWLERAKKAARYEPKHFPFLNLGHIYMIRDEQNQALSEYVRALELDPGNEIANRAIVSMDLIF